MHRTLANRYGGHEAMIQRSERTHIRGNYERVKTSTRRAVGGSVTRETILELPDKRVRQRRNSSRNICSLGRNDRKPCLPSTCSRKGQANEGEASFRPLVFGAIAARNSCCPMVNRTLFEHRGNRSEQVFPMYRHSHPTAISNCGFFQADVSPS